MGFVLNHIMSWVVDRIVDSFQALFSVVLKLLSATPDVTALPQVQTLTARTTTVLDALFVLAFVAAGVLTMVAGGNERLRYTAKDLLPRLVVAFTAAHLSPILIARLITLVDAVSRALTAGRPSGAGALSAIHNEIIDGNAANNIGPLLFAILAALITFLVAAVAFTYLTRIAVLIVLAIAAPLALACHSLPQIEPVARLWWRSVIGCLTVPLLQAITLQAGQTVMLDPHSAGRLFGEPGGGVLSLLITIVLLWLTVKIPGLVRRYVMRTGGGSSAGHFVRVVVIGDGMRLLTGGMSTGGRLAVRGGAALAGAGRRR
jgi:hypothetical protein